MRGTFGFPLFKAIDGNGNPIRGGKLYTYSVGTSNNKATYSDYALTVAHANPVVLNSDGQALIYLSGSYRMNLTTSADGQVPGWPVDNIIGDISTDLIFLKEHIATGLHFAPDARSYTGGTFAAAVTAIGATETTLVISQSQAVTANVTIPSTLTLRFREGGKLNISNGVVVTLNGPVEAPMAQIFTGAGTVVFNRNAKELSPQWWGALGDNSADDTAEFTAAKAAFVAGGTLRLPNGIYRLSNWVFGTSGVIVQGAGAGDAAADSATVLRAVAGLAGTDYVVKIPLSVNDAGAVTMYRAALRDLMIDGNAITRGVLFHGTDCRLENVSIRNCANYAVFSDETVVDSFDGGGIFHCRIYGSSSRLGGLSLTVADSYFNGAGTATAVFVKIAGRMNIVRTTFESWNHPVIDIQPAAGKVATMLTIEGNRILSNQGSGTVINAVASGSGIRGLIIKRNTFHGGGATTPAYWVAVDGGGGPLVIKHNDAETAPAPILIDLSGYTTPAKVDIAHNGNMDVDVKYTSRNAAANMVAAGTTTGWKSVQIDKSGATAPGPAHEHGVFKGKRLKTTAATSPIAFTFPTEDLSAGHWRAKVLAFDTTAVGGAVNLYQVNARSVTETVGAGATVTDLQTVVSEGTAAAAVVWQANGAETEIVELQLTGVAATTIYWEVEVEYDYIVSDV